MNDLSNWLTLYHVPGLGPARFSLLLERLGKPSEIVANPHTALQDCGLQADLIRTIAKAIKTPEKNGVERDLLWLEQDSQHHIITLEDPRYPALLREIPGAPPPILYVKGNAKLLNATQLAMVGSRNPSPTGRDNAQAFSKALSQQGVTVTSGLASGIDAICHRGGLLGPGKTLAVCATGLDTTYPKNHVGLVDTILENQGAIISEFPIGTLPKKEHFPRRNRIISGLSLGTLVIEAAIRSGSLITARHAAEQNREVFAIPGSIHNPLARGCHLLIKQGAKLTETSDDIIEELNLFTSKTICNEQTVKENPTRPIDLIGDKLTVFNALGDEATSVDTLIRRSGLTAEKVSSILLELELRRYTVSTPGGLYSQKR